MSKSLFMVNTFKQTTHTWIAQFQSDSDIPADHIKYCDRLSERNLWAASQLSAGSKVQGTTLLSSQSATLQSAYQSKSSEHLTTGSSIAATVSASPGVRTGCMGAVRWLATWLGNKGAPAQFAGISIVG